MKKGKGKVILLSALLLSGLAAAGAFFGTARASFKRAEELRARGEDLKAWRLYGELGPLFQSRGRKEELRKASPSLAFDGAGHLSSVTFGAWDTEGRGEKSPLTFTVLEKKEGAYFLLCDQVLFPMAYHSAYEPVTWETSSLRSYLNGTFYEEAFSEKEKELIVPSPLSNPDSPLYDTPGGADTLDRVFILSLSEEGAYIRTREEKYLLGRGIPTLAAREMGIRTFGEEECVSCWLRSPGVYPYTAAFVDSGGEIYANGAVVDIETIGVRPALWAEPDL